jgi:hypothetical protein
MFHAKYTWLQYNIKPNEEIAQDFLRVIFEAAFL